MKKLTFSAALACAALAMPGFAPADDAMSPHGDWRRLADRRAGARHAPSPT